MSFNFPAIAVAIAYVVVSRSMIRAYHRSIPNTPQASEEEKYSISEDEEKECPASQDLAPASQELAPTRPSSPQQQSEPPEQPDADHAPYQQTACSVQRGNALIALGGYANAIRFFGPTS